MKWISRRSNYYGKGRGGFQFRRSRARYYIVPQRRRTFVYRPTQRRGFSLYRRSVLGTTYRQGRRYRR